jgi:hypothetical protein
MRELPVCLAILIRTDLQDRSRFSAIRDHGGLCLRALSLAFHAAILAFVERVGRLGTSLPVWSRRDLNWLLPLFHQGFKARLNKRLDFRLVARRIRAQRLVPDLREEERIIPGPFGAGYAWSSGGQQIGVADVKGRVFQIEVNFAVDPIAKLPDGRRFGFAVLQNRGRAAVTGKTLHQSTLLISRLEPCEFQSMCYGELAVVERCLCGLNQICE